ncbi:MAG: NTPase [Planctomycetes bacterium]|nr:NTPase [Planctomycetota bacterium]
MTAPSSRSSSPVRLLLTGPPGCGKTTVVCRVLEQLAGWQIAGFYTRELRQKGRRVGFEAVTPDGRRVLLAHRNSQSPRRVGRYGVELGRFESLVADQLLRPSARVDLYLIDEIGKMECLSSQFVTAVRRVLASPVPLLATVTQKGRGLIAEVKKASGVELLQVTRQNRDAMPQQIVEMFRSR